jgi:hypothetical protein
VNAPAPPRSPALLSLAAAALLVLSAASVSAQMSPWVPDRGQFNVNPVVIFQTYDKFWLGKRKVDFPDTDQQTAALLFEYGLFEDIALDAAVGYVRSIGTRSGAGTDDGLNDTLLGVRWRPLDEYEWESAWVPTVALRAGAIIAGTYETNTPESPGDGANGFEGSLLIGKTFYLGDLGDLGVNADVGYRYRREDVPDDFFCSLGIYKTLPWGLSVNLAFRHVQGLSGPDIGDPGFTFPEVKEVQENLEWGFGYTDDHQRYLGFFMAHTLDGENTSQRLVFGLTYNIPFGGIRPPPPEIEGEPAEE